MIKQTALCFTKLPIVSPLSLEFANMVFVAYNIRTYSYVFDRMARFKDFLFAGFYFPSLLR